MGSAYFFLEASSTNEVTLLTYIREYVTRTTYAVIHELTTVQLKQAVHLREQIETLQEKLDALLGGSSTSAPKKKLGRPKGKRTMSAAGRAKIAAAQKARWAKINGKASSAKAVSAKATPKKKVMSPEAKAKIAAAMKARWAAKKKGAAAE